MIYFLDTDTFGHFHQGNANVLRRITDVGLQNVAITVVTRMEILRARFEFLRKAATAAELRTAQFWLNDSDHWLSRWKIISIDDTACQHFEQLRLQRGLRKAGRADLLIACIALASGATVVTRNVSDFVLIPRLRVENWVD